MFASTNMLGRSLRHIGLASAMGGDTYSSPDAYWASGCLLKPHTVHNALARLVWSPGREFGSARSARGEAQSLARSW